MAGVVGVPLGRFTLRQLTFMFDQREKENCIRHAELMTAIINMHVEKQNRVSVNDYLPKNYRLKTSADYEAELAELDRKIANGEI